MKADVAAEFLARRSPPQPIWWDELPRVLELRLQLRELDWRYGEVGGGLFERLVAGRLLIWLGGIALVAAAVFLIRYSIEIGLVTPELRMIAAAVFGLVLLGLGEYARAGRLLSDDPRIAQALVGAGLVTLYATAYGSHILYGLIGAGVARFQPGSDLEDAGAEDERVGGRPEKAFRSRVILGGDGPRRLLLRADRP